MDPLIIEQMLKMNGLLPALAVAGAWAIREIVTRHVKEGEQNKIGLAELQKELHANTMALTKLTVQMEYMNKAVDSLPEIRKDLDALGAKVRKAAEPAPQ